MKPKKPKKYSFTGYQSTQDRRWNLKLQQAWNEKSKTKLDEISLRHATPTQLKYRAEQLEKNTSN